MRDSFLGLRALEILVGTKQGISMVTAREDEVTSGIY